jgi:hypothetical protein
MLAVFGINALGIILNLFKLDRVYNALLRGSLKWHIFVNTKQVPFCIVS